MVWTLNPNRRLFLLANSVVTEENHRGDVARIWIHENIDIEEARQVAVAVPQVSSEDLDRILRPERCLTLDQIDRYPDSWCPSRSNPWSSALSTQTTVLEFCS